MTTAANKKPSSGVLLALTSLPGPFGVGDLGPEAFRFIDWLQVAGQRYWQILPLAIPDGTGSPYASLSSAAGNWLLISPEVLWKDGLLPTKPRPPSRSPSIVSYKSITVAKWKLVRTSYTHFVSHATLVQRRSYAEFQKKSHEWLDDYALFQAVKDRHQQQPWWSWEKQWQSPKEARQYLDRHMEKQLAVHMYAQWLWAEQWSRVRTYAHRHGVQIIGDMPFFIRTDSVDVWANRNLFLLDKHGSPTVVAGVPPDAFSRDGQRWGNPLYNWPAHRRQQYKWWIGRFRRLASRVDVIRFDHFRGLINTWHIPQRAENARTGKWVPSPGFELLRQVKRHVPHLRLIAEDLGPGKAHADGLRRAFHAPTIRLLMFGWNGLPNNPHAPETIANDTVYYTANHDTNTTVGWWRDEAKWYERLHVRERLHQVDDIAWQSMAVAMQTTSQITIAPMQDILRLGTRGRFNRPGRRRGNWGWRLRTDQVSPVVAKQLRRLTAQFGRTSKA